MMPGRLGALRLETHSLAHRACREDVAVAWTSATDERLVNLLTFNAGLHVEHHDLMGIPWFRLWKLRKLAPEYYDDLDVIPSYTLLGLRFVFANSRTFEENFNHEYQRYADRVTSGEWDPK